MLTLSLDLEVLTPLFMGGADQRAEIRPASFKGALRHWLRAVEEDYPRRESELFGDTGRHGQSPVLLSIHAAGNLKRMNWLDNDELRTYNVGRGVQQKNGLKYLGYTFSLTGNEERNAIAPGCLIRARCRIPNPSRFPDCRRSLRGLFSAWWLLTHIGGLGSRARRGFGSIGLTRWSLEGDHPNLADFKADLDALPLAAGSTSANAFAESMRATLFETLPTWFGAPTSDRDRPAAPLRPDHIGSRTRAVLLRAPASKSRDWAAALQSIGLAFQRFRASRDPDRQRALAHLLFLNNIPSANGIQASPLAQTAPERSAFGLPLSFRARKLNGYRLNRTEFTLTPEGVDARKKSRTRHPAPMWIRVLRIGEQLHPVVTFLDGALPGQLDGIQVDQGGGRYPLQPPGDALIHTFLDHLGRVGLAISGGAR